MKVKIVQNKEIWIWRYPSCNKYESLLSFVSETFGLFNPSSFKLQYQDDENDTINIINDIDIDDAILCAKQESWKSLKISVISQINIALADMFSDPKPVKHKSKNTNPETYSLQYIFINMIPNKKYNDSIKPIDPAPDNIEMAGSELDMQDELDRDVLKNLVDKYQKLFMSINNNVCAWNIYELAQEYSLGTNAISQMKNTINYNKTESFKRLNGISNGILEIQKQGVCTSVAINTPTTFRKSCNKEIFAGAAGIIPLNGVMHIEFGIRQYLYYYSKSQYDSVQKNNLLYPTINSNSTKLLFKQNNLISKFKFILLATPNYKILILKKKLNNLLCNELSELTQLNKDIFIKKTNKKEEENIIRLSLTPSMMSFMNDNKISTNQSEYNPDWTNCIYYIKVL